MKTIINGLFLNGNYGGIHHTAEQLFNSLQDTSQEVDLLVGKGFQKKGKQYLSIKNRLPGRLGRIFFENSRLPGILKTEGYQVYHSMNYVLPWDCSKFKTVVTIHDTISLDYPQFCKNSSIVYHGLLMKKSIRQASKIVAVSQKVKEDILRWLPIDEQKVEVVYHGIDPIFRQQQSTATLERLRRQYKLTSPYLLFVGTIEPKKNLERLIDAFLQLKKQLSLPHKLVLAGQSGWKSKRLMRRIQALEKQSIVQRLDYVAQKDLPALYQLAEALAFPSLYEGFGLPPLEAMASGIPTLVSSHGALPEVTGAHCVMTDPYSHHELVEGLNQLLTNDSLRSRLREKGKVHTAQFTWERAAAKTAAIYQELT